MLPIDYWSSAALPADIDIDCFLPTGVLIPVPCKSDSTLDKIKQELWAIALVYPLAHRLQNKKNYVFVCVNQSAEQEELVDESRRLCDVKPFCGSRIPPLLKLVLKQGDSSEKVFNSHIGKLIGKGLHDYDVMKSEEVKDFRQEMRTMSEDMAAKRITKSWKERALYVHPPGLIPHDNIPEYARRHLREGTVMLLTVILDNPKIIRSYEVPYYYKPSQFLCQFFGDVLAEFNVTLISEDYIIKVSGLDEYLLGEYQLFKYRHLLNLLRPDDYLKLIAVPRQELIQLVDELLAAPCSTAKPTGPPVTPRQHIELWQIEKPYQINILNVNQINTDEYLKLAVKVCIYSGMSSLCDVLYTEGVSSADALWTSTHEFNLNVKNLPRMARLCFVLFTYRDSKRAAKVGRDTIKRNRKKEDETPLFWANTMCFTYKGVLKTDIAVLSMWPVTKELPEQFNYTGTVNPNPNTEAAPTLRIQFDAYCNKPILYPPFDKVIEKAAQVTEVTLPPKISRQQHPQLLSIIERDTLETICDQEVDLVWLLRIDIRDNFPWALPRLLHCVNWSKLEDVAQVQFLLCVWPTLEPELALELLDFKYPDNGVRKFAIKSLDQMNDDQLQSYLLQLVQALKYEPYLDCDLSRFLLTRALNNIKTGHHLFWCLRAEMHVPDVAVRFGLMLEAYCRGSPGHIKNLTCQVEALNKLRSVSELAKSGDKKSQDRVREYLSRNTYTSALQNFTSPLNSCHRLRQLIIEKSRVFDSKMRPLLLVFENEDPSADVIKLIYKNGDDLRQDMLTLQIIHIMDTLWQNEGLDLRMNPYRCISTGHRTGMIEFVENSRTVADIQSAAIPKERINILALDMVFCAFNRASLLDWLRKMTAVENDKALSEKRLDDAIEEFTLSCAGYCVATYVLGIGDRHNDNIMIKTNGQLLHIDFGHILGNFKSKFGVKRERVPFVLTHDFVHVITKGEKSQKHKFDAFRKNCERAFMILRKNYHLLLNLFCMMLSSSMPELGSLRDIEYLRETLVPSYSNEDALHHFQSKFTEALKKSHYTSINWLCRLLARKDASE